MPKKKKEKGEKEGGKFGAFLFVILIVLIWITALAVLIKTDVGGLGTTLRPFIKDVPVVKYILPNVSDDVIAWEENYSYNNLSEAVAKIQELEKQVADLTAKSEEDKATIDELNAEVARLKIFEDNQLAFEERVARFDENVVFNEKALDIDEYRKFYEEIEPANAERIYQYVLQLQQYDEGINEQAKLFSEMKPGQAADTLTQMTADTEWIVKVILAMKTTNATEIMNKMDPLYVARIMQKMSDMNEEQYQNIYNALYGTN